jgi:hypothetical protein
MKKQSLFRVTQKNPARHSARAQFLSFNFPNALICAVVSMRRMTEVTGRRERGALAAALFAGSDRRRSRTYIFCAERSTHEDLPFLRGSFF